MIIKSKASDPLGKNELLFEFIRQEIRDIYILISEDENHYRTYVHRPKEPLPFSTVEFSIKGWLGRESWLGEYGFTQYKIVDNKEF